MTSFRSEFFIYVGRISQFTRGDRRVYAGWVGLMSGLVLATGGFLLVGHLGGISYPFEAWLVPIGAWIFTGAISVDTIGHLTIYRDVLKKAERLVHHITIFTGITACVLLCASYHGRSRYIIPAFVFTALSFLYSLIDEAFHWRRYESKNADRVEMWSHVFILIGHGIMMLGWWTWCWTGYRGVAETIPLFCFG